MAAQLLRSLSTLLFLVHLSTLCLANTRMPDPGLKDDIACTVEVIEKIRLGDIGNNTLLLWPKGTCCTTTDCQLQHFDCAGNSTGNGGDEDVCCYKKDAHGASIGYCRCGINAHPQGTCF